MKRSNISLKRSIRVLRQTLRFKELSFVRLEYRMREAHPRSFRSQLRNQPVDREAET